MSIPRQVKGSPKVMGYFSYTGDGQVFCDGDACIIAGCIQSMKFYLQRMSENQGRDIIKKTRFGEIIDGLRRGGAYAFDQEAYTRFLSVGKMNGMDGLPTTEAFSDPPATMHFIRIQMAEE